MEKIEYLLRDASGENHTVAIPWPSNQANADKIIGAFQQRTAMRLINLLFSDFAKTILNQKKYVFTSLL
jgi:hypothetical protein